ncbi:arylsulfatase [Flammeovirga aprica]|uniref:Arylsulfatase n=1 Tax=Flammeovirga aprica JL-4 TaxID=694437 RepID=A0A7X9XD60_9BACT|nr:arylsulfatase [Flammeovirga aprica]NME72448.1 arylsulfatase [Flammeovirga aprica JL-4]
MRKYFLILVLSVLSLPNVMAQKQKKPNILFILLDDLGYADVGFNGQTKILTPNLDQLASEGMNFTQHYAGAPVCGPSRAVLMTGKHLGHCSVRANPKWTKSGKPLDLDQQDVTVAKELKRAGYTTACIGKWGLGENLTTGIPNQQGFDYFYGFNSHKNAHRYYPEKVWRNDVHERIEGNITKQKKGKYITDLFTAEAKEFIKKNKEKPFYLHLAYTTPHFELTIPEERKAYYKEQNWPLREMKKGHYYHDRNGHVTYASMVTDVDRQIGEVLALLKDLNIDKNTLVIFASDNGHEYDNGKEFFDSNGVYKGKKRDLYEGGIHVPFVAKWEGKIKAGTTCNEMFTFWDFLPTACEIAGIQPTDHEIDGISYLPTLLGKTKKQKQHDYLYWEFNERKGPIQLVRKGDWKLINFIHKDRQQLFKITDDISEQSNLINQYPEKAEELRKILKEARTEHPEFPLVKKGNSK